MALTIDEVWPADGSRFVELGAVVEAILHNADSTAYTKVETTQADFAAGTIAHVTAGADGTLGLNLSVVFDDTFTSDAIGSVPAGYTAFQGTGGFTVQSKDSQNAVRSLHTANTAFYLRRDAPLVADLDVYVDMYADGVGNNDLGIVVRGTGTAWSDLKCYQITFNWTTQKLTLDKIVNGSYSAISTPSVTLAKSAWYTGRVQIIGNAIKARVWARGSLEPSTWTLSVTDSAITGAGAMGFLTYFGNTLWIDNVQTVSQTPGYAPSGSRISPAYALSAVGKFGCGRVEYDATVPTNTSLALSISKDGTSWTSVASGDAIALWAEGDSLAAASIYVKAELATSDTTVTPVLSEVRLIFMPFDPASVELNVDGNAFTTANGKLLWNGSYTRAVFRSVGQAARWWDEGARESSVTMLVKYGGATQSTTTLTVAWIEEIAGRTEGWWASVMDSPAWKCGRADGRYYVIDSGMGLTLAPAEAYYYVVGQTPSEADGFYWVAHPIFADTPEATVVGQPHLLDLAEGLTVRGYNPKDFVETVIVQGWIREDQSETLAVGNPFIRDHGPETVIVAREQLADLPEGTVVYAVNRHNGMSIRIMSVEEAAVLAELGVLVVD